MLSRCFFLCFCAKTPKDILLKVPKNAPDKNLFFVKNFYNILKDSEKPEEVCMLSVLKIRRAAHKAAKAQTENCFRLQHQKTFRYAKNRLQDQNPEQEILYHHSQIQRNTCSLAEDISPFCLLYYTNNR